MQTPIPDTRHSLILRLSDKQDVEAWKDFTEIYQPLVFRLARAKGFQDADAHEIVQEVLVAVAGAVHRWKPDEDRGRFRQWLFQIARNLMINFVTRRKHQMMAMGGDAMTQLLEHRCDPNSDESAEFALEYRREVFRWAAQQVRRQVQAKTWQAFWMTSIGNREMADVAEELGMSVGAVYIARSRVMGRLAEAVNQFEQR